MTDMGASNLMNSILTEPVDLPKNKMTSEELYAWLTGYTACQKKVIELIKRYFEDQR